MLEFFVEIVEWYFFFILFQLYVNVNRIWWMVIKLLNLAMACSVSTSVHIYGVVCVCVWHHLNVKLHGVYFIMVNCYRLCFVYSEFRPYCIISIIFIRISHPAVSLPPLIYLPIRFINISEHIWTRFHYRSTAHVASLWLE